MKKLVCLLLLFQCITQNELGAEALESEQANTRLVVGATAETDTTETDTTETDTTETDTTETDTTETDTTEIDTTAAAVAIHAGKEVSIDYTLRLADDTVVSSTRGKKPVIYIHGKGQMIAGLEKALEGLTVGDKKQIVVQPEQGYGAIDPDLIMEVKREGMPASGLEPGAQLSGADRNGNVRRAQVLEVKEDTVVLDFNHPMAGKVLQFDVEVKDVR